MCRKEVYVKFKKWANLVGKMASHSSSRSHCERGQKSQN